MEKSALIANDGASLETKRLWLQSISGPMPSADELAKYDEVLPGSAERLLRSYERREELMEDQTHHRMSLEQNILSSDSKRATAGMIIAATICFAALLGSVYLGMNGHEKIAAVLFSIPLVSIVGAFIHGTNARKNERKERLQALAAAKQETEPESPE